MLKSCDYFSVSFGSSKPRPPPTPRPPRPHNVAPERGAEGLDEEYMFTSRKPRPDSGFSDKENYYMDESGSFYGGADTDTDGKKDTVSSLH